MRSTLPPSQSAGRTARRAATALRLALALCAALLVAAPGRAADEPGQTQTQTQGLAAGFEQQVRQLAMDGVRHAAGADITRVDVQVGNFDPRLRLAPCAQVQPYIPVGSALWGRTRIGLRCVQGEKPWNVFLPVTVKVMGNALVAAAALPAGHVLSDADFAQAEVDLAESTSAAVKDAGMAQGRVLSRPLLPGQSLREAHLKPRQWFAAGEMVKVVALGMGFSVVSQGVAVTPGLEGQVARVKLDSGRVLTGTPVADRQMELPL